MIINTYIGDGVYASYDGYLITLTTSNGIEVTNTIHLEPEVYFNLINFVTNLKETKK